MEENTSNTYSCRIYKCGACGGEITYHGRSASGKCIYCGSEKVRFDRESRETSPEFILPFSVSKEQALSLAREKVSKSFFAPKALKEIPDSAIRGMYIPFWICDVMYAGAAVIFKYRRRSVRYATRNSLFHFTNMPQDASLLLDDGASLELEPFSFSRMKLFDETRLDGYYSGVSDIKKNDLVWAIRRRAEGAFEEGHMKAFRGTDGGVKNKLSHCLVSEDTKYALLPVWVISLEVKGKPITILVNGDSGKVVANLPCDKKRIVGMTALLGLGLSAIAALLIFLHAKYTSSVYMDPEVDHVKSTMYLSVLYGVMFFAAGVGVLKWKLKKIKDPPASLIFHKPRKKED